MEVAGLTLAVVAEFRELLRTLKQRWQNFKYNPITFSNLLQDAARIEDDIKDCDRQFRLKALRLPQLDTNLVRRSFESINKRFEDSLSTLNTMHSKNFPDTNSSAAKKATAKVHQAVKATAIRNELGKVSETFHNVNSEIMIITNLLRSSHVSEKLDQNCTTHEKSCKSTAPSLTHREVLQFDGCDENGDPTPERKLKEHVLRTLGATVTAATGDASHARLERVQSAQGMAGVGKTVALRGLAAEKDIRKQFAQIHYITLGHDASTARVISELCRIVRESGKESQSERVSKCRDVGEAVRATAERFSDIACLFLVDDVWQTPQNIHGYLPALRQLLSSCRQSRMVISTRDQGIAKEAGHCVKFGTRDTQTSREIFLRYFEADAKIDGSLGSAESNMNKILELCAGLPLALAIAGRAAEQLKEVYGSAEKALSNYAKRLESKKSCILNASWGEYKSLRCAIEVSLEFLDENVTYVQGSENMKGTRGRLFGDLYRSLCVLKSQAWAPTSMIERLWGLSTSETEVVMELFGNLSLASVEYRKYGLRRGGEECGQVCISIHDLQLEYCQEQARERQMNKACHRKLLGGYLRSEGDDIEIQEAGGIRNAFYHTNTMQGKTSGHLCSNNSVNMIPENRKHESTIEARSDPWTAHVRPWWSGDLCEDNYIHANLARHLVQAGKAFELLGLLLDARWTKARLKVGGILALQEDFEVLIGDRITCEGDEEYEQTRRYSEDLAAILNAIRCSWKYMSDIEQQMPTQLGARLFELRRISVSARRYLKSVEKNTKRPFLEALSPFLPDSRSALVNELQLGEPCFSLEYSSCGKYILVGAGMDVVVVDVQTLVAVSRFTRGAGYMSSPSCVPHSCKIVSIISDTTVKVSDMRNTDENELTLEGHNEDVTCVSASSDGAFIASGSQDETVRVWDLRSTTNNCQVLRGHTRMVKCICFSPDGTRVASGSFDCTLRMWNIQNGQDVLEFTRAHSGAVYCIAFSLDGRLLASGSEHWEIRLWNVSTGASVGKVLEGHSDSVSSVSFNADGSRIVSASYNGSVRIWDVQKCEVIFVFEGHTAIVRSAKFSFDEKRVISGSEDGTLRVWDLTKAGVTSKVNRENSRVVESVAFSEDGSLIATGSHFDCTIHLWDMRNGAVAERPLEGHKIGVACVAFSPDGTLLSSGLHDGTVQVWDVATGARIFSTLEGLSRAVICFAFSADGALLASVSEDSTVRLWDTRTGVAVGDTLRGHKEPVEKVWFSRDGTKIVSLSGDDYRCIWAVPQGELLWMSGGCTDEKNVLSDVEAQVVIESCDTGRASGATAEPVLYCENGNVMMRQNESCSLLATLPKLASVRTPVKYFQDRKQIVAVLQSGIPAVLRLRS